jgi:hypothetical protein
VNIKPQRLYSGNGTTSSDEIVATHKVLLSGPSAISGALPEALCSTFPERFPTLSAARRGATLLAPYNTTVLKSNVA